MSLAARSQCPITCSLDLLGDRWTLVVLRDILLGKRRYFSEFAQVEGIATNVLTERLNRLKTAGLLIKEQDPADGRRRRYVPTPRGLDLIPVLLELGIWGTKHTPGESHGERVAAAVADRASLEAALRSS